MKKLILLTALFTALTSCDYEPIQLPIRETENVVELPIVTPVDTATGYNAVIENQINKVPINHFKWKMPNGQNATLAVTKLYADSNSPFIGVETEPVAGDYRYLMALQLTKYLDGVQNEPNHALLFYGSSWLGVDFKYPNRPAKNTYISIKGNRIRFYINTPECDYIGNIEMEKTIIELVD